MSRGFFRRTLKHFADFYIFLPFKHGVLSNHRRGLSSKSGISAGYWSRHDLIGCGYVDWLDLRHIWTRSANLRPALQAAQGKGHAPVAPGR